MPSCPARENDENGQQGLEGGNEIKGPKFKHKRRWPELRLPDDPDLADARAHLAAGRPRAGIAAELEKYPGRRKGEELLPREGDWGGVAATSGGAFGEG